MKKENCKAKTECSATSLLPIVQRLRHISTSSSSSRIGIRCIIFILLIFCMGQVFPQQCGDVDSSGVVNIIDALLIAQDYVGLNPANYDPSVANVDGNSGINIVDALLVAQYYVGLIPSLTGCSGTTNPPTPNPGNPPCSSFSEWNANAVYSITGQRVYYNGNIYENKWYSQSQNPEENSGPNDVWTLIGPCDPLATVPPTPEPTPLPPELRLSPLHVQGNWIKDENNNNVVLKGVALADLDAIYKGDRDQSVPTTVFDIIDIGCSAGWQVDVFRLTVHPQVCDETGCHGWINYTPDAYFSNILDPAVQYVIGKGKYVIIDWHYVGVDWTGAEVIRNTETFWNYIAPRYAHNPNVIFELFNEPGYGVWSDWQPRAQSWINMIRNHSADNLIIVGGPTWSQVTPGNSNELLSGGNIVYACHIYPQHGVPNWIDWIANNAPVIMTEWGYESGAPNPVDGTSGWGNQFKNYINSKPNVGWIAWCFDFVYRSVMFDKNWVLLGNGQTTGDSRFHGGPDDTSVNYMGQFVKNWLAE